MKNTKEEDLAFEDFVSAQKGKAIFCIVKELLRRLCDDGFNIHELLYAVADIFKERGELDQAAIYLEKACEHLPAGLRWKNEENVERQ